MPRFELSHRSSAAREILFDLLSEAREWPAWFRPVRRVEWIGEGRVRRVFIGSVAVDEEIVASERPSQHAYRILTRVPVRDHRSDVWFRETDDGTEVLWITTFAARVPGTGWLVAAGLRAGVERLAQAMIAQAERVTLERQG